MLKLNLSHREDYCYFVINAQDKIENWENLSQIECLSKLFCMMPRALGKYVKEIFLYRRSTEEVCYPYSEMKYSLLLFVIVIAPLSRAEHLYLICIYSEEFMGNC